MIKITERTLYEPITRLLEENFKATAISEVGIGEGFLDIFFKLDSYPFIIEIKLGKEERTFTKAIAQVVDYGLEYGTKNIIVLIFPNIERGQTILEEHIERFKQQVPLQKVRGWVHTDYLEEWIESKTLKDVFEKLKIAFEKRFRKIDFNSVVKAIREVVQDLYEVIRQSKTKEIFEEVAKKLELFTSLGEIKDKKSAESQVSMLASYLLFNQLLFYHIYKIKTKDEKLGELKPIKSIRELKEYFSQITDIDYQPIYAINLIDKIPEKPETIELINRAIKNILVIRAEHITHDLAGRFFHALLPKEVAKVWAAFYTNPNAAEILASLAIDRWDETVLDPACGSGTLLCAAYRRKLELYEKEKGSLDEGAAKRLHKKFLEEDITGIDIMPFAAHLTAVNLSLQKLEQTTNFVRVARMDSLLDLSKKVKTVEFNEKGIIIKPFTEEAQSKLFRGKEVLKKYGALSVSGKGKEFYLKPVDVVIMNPPFSDREKLPSDYLEKLKELSELGKICGHQVNLWGYFLALVYLVLKPNGKIAAVLPINIARGKATEKIRNFLLENYRIRYIIKSCKDIAFSESAILRDILLIAEKRKPRKEDITCIIFIKKSVKGMDEKEIKTILNELSILPMKVNEVYVGEAFDALFINYEQLLANKENLMKLIGLTDLKRNKVLHEFIRKFETKLTSSLANYKLKPCLPYRPKNATRLFFVTNPLNNERLHRAFLILTEESKNKIIVKVKNTNFKFEINKRILEKGIRSYSGLSRINLSQSEFDYILISNPKITLHQILPLRGFDWKKHKELNIILANLIIPTRIDPTTKNMHLLAWYSDESFVPNGTFICIDGEKEDLKLLSLLINSIVVITQFLISKSETMGRNYINMWIEDWKEIRLPAIPSNQKQILLNLFEKIKDIEFPSLLEQLEKRFWARIELDKTILKILGFSDKEIEEWLPKAYDAIVEELKAMKEVK